MNDARQFNAQGATPANLTERDVLRADDENDWHTAEEIRLLASIAALFHDFGKANDAFQKKLTSKIPIADAYRHEWVSLRLFEAFVGQGSDLDWLNRLTGLSDDAGAACLEKLKLLSDGVGNRRIAPPFKKLPPLAQVVGWLIVSHHRLPTPTRDSVLNKGLLEKMQDQFEHDWCGSHPDQASAQACWQFKNGLPFNSQHWRQHTAKVAQAILQRPRLVGDGEAAKLLDSPFILHISRMALMLADHYYSGQDSHTPDMAINRAKKARCCTRIRTSRTVDGSLSNGWMNT